MFQNNSRSDGDMKEKENKNRLVHRLRELLEDRKSLSPYEDMNRCLIWKKHAGAELPHVCCLQKYQHYNLMKMIKEWNDVCTGLHYFIVNVLN